MDGPGEPARPAAQHPAAPPEVLGASDVLGAPEVPDAVAVPGTSEARSPSPAPATGGHGAYGATAEFYELAAAGSPEIAEAWRASTRTRARSWRSGRAAGW
ncbi:hypothetical protein BJF90_00885 [Pseudonocardia sp. CNS-004]|nr:hypothetical protein BJF90_00885 [Pseudonocardia sp. CNS-004]